MSASSSTIKDRIDFETKPISKPRDDQYSRLFQQPRWRQLDACVEKVKRGEADINDCVNHLGETILHLACMSGHINFAQWAIDQDHIDINKQTERGKFTALHYVVLYYKTIPDNEKILEILISHPNINLNVESQGQTPLYLAARHNQPKLANYLYAHGARVGECTLHSCNTKHCAIEYLIGLTIDTDSERLPALKILLELGEIVSTDALRNEITSLNASTIELMLQYTVNLKEVSLLKLATQILDQSENKVMNAQNKLEQAKIEADMNDDLNEDNDEVWEAECELDGYTLKRDKAKSIVIMIQDALQQSHSETPQSGM